jgi:hypothetical protein
MMWRHCVTYRYHRIPRAAYEDGLDIPTAPVGITTLALLSRVEKVPEPLVILGAPVAGINVRSYDA